MKRVDWTPFVVVAAVLAALLVIFGIVKVVQEGIRERDAEPPRVVVDREHKVERRRRCTKDSDGDERCRWVTDETYYLISREGYTCTVDERVYRMARIGQPHKCMQLFGWSE